MNDKLKGLLLGLSIGTMLTGSIAYASGTQIEVYFQNIKYMFDGFEKKTTEEQGQGFIYNGTTYVPLRFVSEALGKEVQWDSETETAWIGKKVDMSSVVATYEGGQVTRGEYEKYLAIIQLIEPSRDEPDDEYKKMIVDQMIASRIVESKLGEEAKAKASSAVDTQMNDPETKKFLGSRASEMSKKSITEADIRQYIHDTVAIDTWLQTFVTDELLKQSYDKLVQSKDESVVSASVRHILIMKEDEDGKQRSKEAVAQKVKEVQEKLKNGGDFAALAKQYSEDTGSKDNGGLYKGAPVTDWGEAFQKAAMTLELNKISEPVESEYGFHIMRVESRGTIPYDRFDTMELKYKILDQQYRQLMDVDLPRHIKTIELPK